MLHLLSKDQLGVAPFGNNVCTDRRSVSSGNYWHIVRKLQQYFINGYVLYMLVTWPTDILSHVFFMQLAIARVVLAKTNLKFTLYYIRSSSMSGYLQ
jgi:hypothetical protein